MGPVFLVSPETLTCLMNEAAKDNAPIEVMPSAQAMERCEAPDPTLDREQAGRTGGVIDLTGQDPSAVDPVAHRRDAAKLMVRDRGRPRVVPAVGPDPVPSRTGI